MPANVQKRPPHVLVFDSGLGGLTILKAIKAALPAIRLDYLSDNAGYPYGTKHEDEVIARCERVLIQAEKKLNPDLIVVACNSASTIALAHVRSHLRCPIVGVVPAIKPAAKSSHSRVIGLLATPGTISRAYTHQLIHQFAGDCDVICVGNSRLVEIAERKLYGETPDPQEIAEILQPFHQHAKGDVMDTMILACTHFPLLQPELSTSFQRKITWIDSAEAIAKRVQSLLPKYSGLAAAAGTAWFTGAGSTQLQLRNSLASFGLVRRDRLSDCHAG